MQYQLGKPSVARISRWIGILTATVIGASIGFLMACYAALMYVQAITLPVANPGAVPVSSLTVAPLDTSGSAMTVYQLQPTVNATRLQ